MSVNNYLIEGEDYVSVQCTIKDAILKNNFNEVVSECYDLVDNSLEKALEDLDNDFLSMVIYYGAKKYYILLRTKMY